MGKLHEMRLKPNANPMGKLTTIGSKSHVNPMWKFTQMAINLMLNLWEIK